MISYLCFCIWLASLSMIISKSTHVAANGIISFFFMTNIPYIYIYIITSLSIFILTVDGHLGCFLVQFSSVQWLSRVWLFSTPWTAARQASLSITNSRSSPTPMSIESGMLSSHLILCRPLLLLPLIPPSISLFQWVNSSHEVAKVLEFQL